MSHQHLATLEHSDLGKQSSYDACYNPDRLFAIPRKEKRAEINIHNELPFFGCDIWNHYEVSWLDQKGKPIVAVAQITYPCDSPNIIESKSMKLYFNSLNNTKFDTPEVVQNIIAKDISDRVGVQATVIIKLLPLKDGELCIAKQCEGLCIDELDIDCSTYLIEPRFLKTINEPVIETVYSNLLKSNCLITNQPDWGSIFIVYKGNKIEHSGLLRYIVSFRNHNEFHEQCVERIFMDLMRCCKPEELTVFARYTRRGGLDINPYRSTKQSMSFYKNTRLIRQ